MPEMLNQDRKPRIHDRISFFHTDLGTWVEATLISNALRGWRNYYNIVYDNGREDGVYLIPDHRWTLLDPPQEDQGAVHQLDGMDDPASLTPTPETSPEYPIGPSETGTRAKTGLRLNLGHYLSSDSSVDSVNPLDRSRTDSMAWDAIGTDLESPPRFFNLPIKEVLLDKASNLELRLPISSTPISPHQTPPEDLNLLQPINLEHRLPISSTPVTPRRPRISNPRRSLPLELEQENNEDSIPAFLTRLNPFRKKKKPTDL